MTQVNLRNLLFGRYLPSESGGSQYQEVQGFDQYERIVQDNIKKNNEKSPQEVVNILPIRYVCEIFYSLMNMFNSMIEKLEILFSASSFHDTLF